MFIGINDRKKTKKKNFYYLQWRRRVEGVEVKGKGMNKCLLVFDHHILKQVNWNKKRMTADRIEDLQKKFKCQTYIQSQWHMIRPVLMKRNGIKYILREYSLFEEYFMEFLRESF